MAKIKDAQNKFKWFALVCLKTFSKFTINFKHEIIIKIILTNKVI